MPSLTHHDDGVAVLDLGDDENLFRPDWMVEVAGLLDEVVDGTSSALVTIGSGPKIWSNGLDLAWVQANPTEFQPYVSRAQHLMAKMLELPVPTVAAITGHAFGAGAMLALCHDQRVMRSDRGYWCLPEADINIPFTPGMNDLIVATVAPQAARVAMTTAKRWTAEQALAADIVDAIAPQDEVVELALALARPLTGKIKHVIGAIKSRLHERPLESLRQD